MECVSYRFANLVCGTDQYGYALPSHGWLCHDPRSIPEYIPNTSLAHLKWQAVQTALVS
jgi:hypothetical protein